VLFQIPSSLAEESPYACAQDRVRVVEKAALPPAVRKASGFPPQTASLLASAGRLSLPADPKGLVRRKPSERRSLSASRVRGTAEPPCDVTFPLDATLSLRDLTQFPGMVCSDYRPLLAWAGAEGKTHAFGTGGAIQTMTIRPYGVELFKDQFHAKYVRKLGPNTVAYFNMCCHFGDCVWSIGCKAMLLQGMTP